MSSSSSHSKVLTTSEQWDTVQRKLIIYVMEGRDLRELKTQKPLDEMNLACRIVFSGQKQKKTVPIPVVKGLAAWNELVFLDLSTVDTSLEITIEVTKEGDFFKNVVGSALLLPIDFLAPHVVLENNAELRLSKGKKGDKKYREGKTGTVQIRMYLSEQRETTGKPPQDLFYHYNDIKKKHLVKPGDLILYSEPGLLPTTMKVMRNSLHNRAGIVVRLPNKFTGEPKLYVFELTRNLEGYIDAFDEKPRSGTLLFRLWERVHQVSGGEVFWCPLKKPLSDDTTKNLSDWVRKVQMGKVELKSYFSPVSPIVTNFLTTLMIRDPTLKEELRAAQSTDVIAEALRIGGVRLELEEGKSVGVEDLIKLPCFGELVAFRSALERTSKRSEPEVQYIPQEPIRSQSQPAKPTQFDQIPTTPTFSAPLLKGSTPPKIVPPKHVQEPEPEVHSFSRPKIEHHEPAPPRHTDGNGKLKTDSRPPNSRHEQTVVNSPTEDIFEDSEASQPEEIDTPTNGYNSNSEGEGSSGSKSGGAHYPDTNTDSSEEPKEVIKPKPATVQVPKSNIVANKPSSSLTSKTQLPFGKTTETQSRNQPTRNSALPTANIAKPKPKPTVEVSDEEFSDFDDDDEDDDEDKSNSSKEKSSKDNSSSDEDDSPKNAKKPPPKPKVSSAPPVPKKPVAVTATKRKTQDQVVLASRGRPVVKPAAPPTKKPAVSATKDNHKSSTPVSKTDTTSPRRKPTVPTTAPAKTTSTKARDTETLPSKTTKQSDAIATRPRGKSQPVAVSKPSGNPFGDDSEDEKPPAKPKPAAGSTAVKGKTSSATTSAKPAAAKPKPGATGTAAARGKTTATQAKGGSGNPFDDDDPPRKKSPVTAPPKGKPGSSASAQKPKTAAGKPPPKKGGGGNPFDDDDSGNPFA